MQSENNDNIRLVASSFPIAIIEEFDERYFYSTLLAAPNSLVLVSVQHSISSSSVLFLLAEKAVALAPLAAEAVAGGVDWLLRLCLEAAAAYENFPGNGACFCTMISLSIGRERSTDAVVDLSLLIGDGFIFFVLLHIQERVLLCETYAPSKGTGSPPRTANTAGQKKRFVRY